MRVEELMTRDPVTVSPDAPLSDVAGVLSARRISGVPVCDARGRLLGVVSETDIVRKEGGPPEERGPLAALFRRDDEAVVKAAARTAGEAMTSPAVTIAPGQPVATAARLMIERDVNRLPVVQEGTLVGIVARSDLVRAFHRSDEELQRDVREDALLDTLWIDPARVTVEVEQGVVTLQGEVGSRSDAELAAAHARRVPGVVDVSSHLTWTVDDHARSTATKRVPRRI